MEVIGSVSRKAEEKVLSGALLPLQKFLTASLVEAWCRQCEHTWRVRLWSPFVTVLACIYKQLELCGARQVEDWIASLDGLPCAAESREGDSFCAARKRLNLEILRGLAEDIGALTTRLAGRFFHGLPVLLIDATTMRVPRTKENIQAFGLTKNQFRSSALPVARLLLLVCDGCGAVMKYLVNGYHTSELAQLRELLLSIQAGSLVLADRGFSGYVVLWSLDASGIYFLARQHQTRKGKRIRKLGKNDALYEWERPPYVCDAWQDVLPGCDAKMVTRVVRTKLHQRGHRDRDLILCTNLQDPEKYAAQELLDLYLERWNIELDIRTLKLQHVLERLTAQSPYTVQKEIASTLLAFNCVRLTMAEAEPAFRKLSHKRACHLILELTAEMAHAPTLVLPVLYQHLLNLIRTACLRRRKRRSQPRAVIHRKRDWPVLTVSRGTWRRTGRVAS